MPPGPDDGPGQIKGMLDHATATLVEGWVYDVANPYRPVTIDISVDGTRVTTMLANRMRLDLRDAGFGDGACAFSWQPETPLDPTRPHIISVQAHGSTELNGAPRLIGLTSETVATIDRICDAAALTPEALHGILSRQISRLLELREPSVASGQ